MITRTTLSPAPGPPVPKVIVHKILIRLLAEACLIDLGILENLGNIIRLRSSFDSSCAGWGIGGMGGISIVESLGNCSRCLYMEPRVSS